MVIIGVFVIFIIVMIVIVMINNIEIGVGVLECVSLYGLFFGFSF